MRSYSRRTGIQLGGGLTEANEGDYFVRLTPTPRRSIYQVMDEVRQRIQQRVPGLEIELAQLMEDLIGDLTAVPQPIEVKLFGAAPDELRTEAKRVADRIGKIAGVVDVEAAWCSPETPSTSASIASRPNASAWTRRKSRAWRQSPWAAS